MVCRGFQGFLQTYSVQSINFGQTFFVIILYIAIVYIKLSSEKANPRCQIDQRWLVSIDSKLAFKISFEILFKINMPSVVRLLACCSRKCVRNAKHVLHFVM